MFSAHYINFQIFRLVCMLNKFGFISIISLFMKLKTGCLLSIRTNNEVLKAPHFFLVKYICCNTALWYENARGDVVTRKALVEKERLYNIKVL